MVDWLDIAKATPSVVADQLTAPREMGEALLVDWAAACRTARGGFGEVRKPDDWRTVPDSTGVRVVAFRLDGVVDGIRWLDPNSPEASTVLGGTTHDYLCSSQDKGVILAGWVTRDGDRIFLGLP